jgi:DNA-binding transcriptional MerR regulator
MPDKVWFKIGEASRLVGATPKELRYWERVIPELQPRRSKGNLRYYHQDELVRLERIRQWLAEGFTVSDCRGLLQEAFPGAGDPTPRTEGFPPPSRLQAALDMLHALQARLSAPAGAPRPAAEPQSLEKPVKTPVQPKRAPKPKPQESALGRMWTGGRLPLDLED